jgi:hypothetical protein
MRTPGFLSLAQVGNWRFEHENIWILLACASGELAVCAYEHLYSARLRKWGIGGSRMRTSGFFSLAQVGNWRFEHENIWMLLACASGELAVCAYKDLYSSQLREQGIGGSRMRTSGCFSVAQVGNWPFAHTNCICMHLDSSDLLKWGIDHMRMPDQYIWEVRKERDISTLTNILLLVVNILSGRYYLLPLILEK